MLAFFVFAMGITSACAEQIAAAETVVEPLGDHLRVCGADSRVRMGGITVDGSPPRVRSRLPIVSNMRQLFGITSACAEQTSTR